MFVGESGFLWAGPITNLILTWTQRGLLDFRGPRHLGEVLRHSNQAPNFSWEHYYSHCQRKMISWIKSYWKGHIYNASLGLMAWDNVAKFVPTFLLPSFHTLQMTSSFSYFFLLPFVIRFDDYKRENAKGVVASWAHALNSNYHVFLVQFNAAGITQTPMECQTHCLRQ